MPEQAKRKVGRPKSLPEDSVMLTPRLAGSEGERLEKARANLNVTQQQFLRRAIMHAIRLVESGISPEYLLADIE